MAKAQSLKNSPKATGSFPQRFPTTAGASSAVSVKTAGSRQGVFSHDGPS
jgi:hypothetical protein